MWPSTFQLWPAWIRSLLVAEPTDVVEREKSGCRNFVVWTDASLLGWGCIVQWPSGKTISQGGRWSVKEAKLHISELEARVVKIALITFVPQYSKVEIFIDNTSVLGAIGKGRSRNFALNRIVELLSNQWTIVKCTYIRSEDNPADELSRRFPSQLTSSPQIGLEEGKEN